MRNDGTLTGFAKRALWLIGMGCLLATAVAGCATGGSKSADANEAVDAPVKPEFRYKVVAEQADFFHSSVQQPGGADEKLKKDARVTLVRRYGGYSQIKANGSTGYVSSDEVARISVQESAAEDAALLARQAPPNALAPVTGGPGGTYSIPPEAARDTVLPVQDAPSTTATPKPTPNPMFRY